MRMSEREAGASARNARELAQPDEWQRWNGAAVGEETVGRELAKLPATWHVLHDLPVNGGPGNIDHLVIGPAGIFTINTKNYSETTVASHGALYVGGAWTSHVSAAEAEARHVGRLVAAADDMTVTPLLVFTSPLVVKQQPARVTALAQADLIRWFAEQPAHYGPDAVRTIFNLADEPSTWGVPAGTPVSG
jgi:hypothetical protein